MKKLLIAVYTIVTFSVACKSKPSAEEIGIAKQATIDSVNAINNAKQAAVDSVNAVKEKNAHSERSAATTTTTTTTTTAEKKKGWSSTAKGAVIGAGAGALTGALVSKQKGTGAVVGGLVGAGAGAATGAIIDKNKKKKQQQ